MFTDVSQQYQINLRNLNKITWRKIERDWREIFAGGSNQSAQPSGICYNDSGEAQGEIPGQTVLEAARKHYEKDPAVSVAGH